MSRTLIKLTDAYKVNALSSSNGNLLKWFYKGYWYKADQIGLGSMSEVICSRFAKQLGFPYMIAEYYPCIINYNNKLYRGCYSKDFNSKPLITLNSLYTRITGGNIYTDLLNKELSAKRRICETFYVLNKVPQNDNIPLYISYILAFDELILNTDRHTHNILFYVSSDGSISPAPLFDNGEALLSNTEKYSGKDLRSCCYNAKSKPFSRSFKQQTQVLQDLYDVVFRNLGLVDYKRLVVGLEEYYTTEEINRALNILQFQVQRVQARSK